MWEERQGCCIERRSLGELALVACCVRLTDEVVRDRDHGRLGGRGGGAALALQRDEAVELHDGSAAARLASRVTWVKISSGLMSTMQAKSLPQSSGS